MVELIIQESGFPKYRETLTEFQQSFQLPIDELLRRLPGNRILKGFVPTYGVSDTVTYTEGVLIFKGKLWTIEPYSGTIAGAENISFFETTVLEEFNVGTQENPIVAMRPWKIERTARVGVHTGRTHLGITSQFLRGRQALEYLKAGSLFVGPIMVDVGTAVYSVNFREDIGTKDYLVLGNFRAADADETFSRAFTWDINNRKKTGFDIFIQQATANSLPLIFDYTVIPINRNTTLETED